MIPSAVVIPPLTSSRESNDPSIQLKRKLSLSLQHERKKPKVDTDTLDYDDKPDRSPELTPKSAATTTELPHRRSSALAPGRGNAVEEKKRNQRLFGSLLGTLSQTAIKPNAAHKKRDEIEARQRERLKREHEEQDAARKHLKDELARNREREQQRWKAESTKLKHANMRAMSGFLKTKTKPVLYYLPWDLREDEQAQVQRQNIDVERLIRKELGQDNPEESIEAESRSEAREYASPSRGRQESSRNLPDPDLDDRQDQEMLEQNSSDDKCEPENGHVHIYAHETKQHELAPVAEQEHPSNDASQNPQHKNDDHQGEELVEGQEDDLIY